MTVLEYIKKNPKRIALYAGVILLLGVGAYFTFTMLNSEEEQNEAIALDIVLNEAKTYDYNDEVITQDVHITADGVFFKNATSSRC
jgi:hypothetical protein